MFNKYLWFIFLLFLKNSRERLFLGKTSSELGLLFLQDFPCNKLHDTLWSTNWPVLIFVLYRCYHAEVNEGDKMKEIKVLFNLYSCCLERIYIICTELKQSELYWLLSIQEGSHSMSSAFCLGTHCWFYSKSPF